jgi:hypothetical protein
MDYVHTAETFTKSHLDRFLSNPYIMAVVKITLLLYVSQLAPRLPGYITNMFKNTFVKLICVALIAYLANVDFQLSLLLALIFVLGGNLASGRGPLESFEDSTQGPFYVDQTQYTNLLDGKAIVGDAKLLDGTSDIYTGCNGIKMDDLLSIFDGDAVKLQDKLSNSFKQLIEQLPSGDSAKTKLYKMAISAGLPYNIQFNDQNAPLIGTILLNNGVKVSKTCTAPYQDGPINV